MDRSFTARTRALIAGALSLALALGTLSSADAQATSYVSGTVSFKTAPLAGADVELVGNNLDVHKTTDAEGRFTFNGLGVGEYTLTAKKGDVIAAQSLDLTGAGATLSLSATQLQEIGHVVVANRPPVVHSSGTDVTLNAQTLSKLPDTNSLPNILVQLPAAARGSNGQIHLNGDHAGISYIVDGVPLPEELNRVLGNEIDPSTIDFVNVIEGAYPAQYGNHFGGVLDIGTKSYAGPAGASFDGSVGSFNTYDGIATVHAPVGRGGSLVVSGRLSQDGRALDPPVQSMLHDTGSDASQFIRLSLPANGSDFLNVDVIHSLQTFQIPPDLSNGVPAATNDDEYQDDTFLAVQYRHQIGANASLSFGPSYKTSRVLDTNDLANDLAGAAGLPLLGAPAPPTATCTDFSNCPFFSVFADRSSQVMQFNADYASHSKNHDLRFGTLLGLQAVPKNYVITIQPGNQLSPTGAAYTVTDTSTNNGTSQGYYAQDSWRFQPHWQLDYGVRYDQFTESSTGYAGNWDQTSPRVKLTRDFGSRTSVYVYYGRLFEPFSLESISPQAAAALYVPSNLPGGLSFDLKPERDSLYEAGFHVPAGAADVGFRISQRNATDWIDDTQVGATNLHQDINFPQGRVSSQSVYANAPLERGGRTYLSVTHSIAVNSFNCETQLLQNCSLSGPPGGDFVQADHDQHWDASGGTVLNDRHGGWVSLDGEYGSGLSLGLPAVANPCAVVDCINYKTAPHLVFNLAKGVGTRWGQLVFSVENLFNDEYAITFDNSLQGTHYARPRSFNFRLVVGSKSTGQ